MVRHARSFGRLVIVLAMASALQACGALANVRVAPLQHENSSSQRSMLSLFNPLPMQHRSASHGMLLRAPEDRNGRYRYLGY